jgi:C-terminal binding protein
LGIKRMESITALLERSKVVSLHCPLTPETFHLINADTLKIMPRRSYLINTARGAVIDTKAIPDAIRSGQLAGAGIDVLEQEPPSDQDELVRAWKNPEHPAFHKVIINPHSAFYSEEGLQEIRTRSAQACKLAFEGLPLRNIVN